MDWAQLLTVRFRPNVDLGVVALACALVTASLATATFVVTAANGVGYFLVYALVTALLAGVVLPTWWTVWHQKRTVADLGVTSKNLGLCLVLQIGFAVLQYFATFFGKPVPPLMTFLPLVALSLCIAFFEALFWRGFVFQRLEDSFGLIPALVVGSALYAVYHVGYGMPWSEIAFLFIVGLVYAAVFRITRSVFILWPLLQPMGQLTTLVRDGLSLPPIAIVGFLEVLAAMVAVVFVAHRYAKKRGSRTAVGRDGVDEPSGSAGPRDSTEFPGAVDPQPETP